jgi:hypothetical protein
MPHMAQINIVLNLSSMENAERKSVHLLIRLLSTKKFTKMITREFSKGNKILLNHSLSIIIIECFLTKMPRESSQHHTKSFKHLLKKVLSTQPLLETKFLNQNHLKVNAGQKYKPQALHPNNLKRSLNV